MNPFSTQNLPRPVPSKPVDTSPDFSSIILPILIIGIILFFLASKGDE